MSFSKSLGSAVGAKRLMVSPSFEIRNLVKFHRMSLSFSTLLLREGLQQGAGSLCLQSLVFLGGCLCLQILEDGLGFFTVNITLSHNLEGHAIVHLAELLNLFIALGVLLLELVAGEADDDEPLVLILLVQLLQSCELRGESTLAGCVHNQQYLTLKL